MFIVCIIKDKKITSKITENDIVGNNNMSHNNDNKNDSHDVINAIVIIILTRVIKSIADVILMILALIKILSISILEIIMYIYVTLWSIIIFVLVFFRYIVSGNATQIDVYDITLHILTFIVNALKYVHSKSMMILIRTFILPIIDYLYPVFDIEKKFYQIISLNEKNLLILLDHSDFGCVDQPELTQQIWNNYVMYLSKLKENSNLERDMFDVMIIQQIEKINFDVSLGISNSDTDPKCITFAVFRKKLEKNFGDAIKTKYRCTKNVMFEGIFKDQGPYRRFRFYDTI